MLDGVAVVEVANLLPGPFGGARLAAMGADVTKVEPPGGDPAKRWVGDAYEALNGDKTVVELDLTGPGRDELADRVAEADVVVTANRPSTLQKLGVTAPDLHGIRDDLVVVQLLGHDDPEALGHDLTYQADAGLLDPEAGLPPVPLADLAAGERVAAFAAAGLYRREQAGEGVVARVVAETVAGDWAAAGLPVAELLEIHPGYDVYPCEDGLLAVACLEERYWTELCERLGEPGWADRPDGVREALADRLASRSASAWLDALAGLPLAKVPKAGGAEPVS